VTLIPEVLFNISIEDLLSGRQAWQIYKREQVENVGQFLRCEMPAFPGFKKTVSDAAILFVENWGGLAQSFDLGDGDPSGISVALYQYRQKAGIGLADHDGGSRKNSRHHDLLMSASLSKMARLLGNGDSELQVLSPDSQIDSFSHEVQNLLFKVALTLLPIKLWKIEVWVKFIPTRVFNARIQGQFFEGNLSTLIHNIANHQGWETFGDFARVTPEDRFWIRGFGPSCRNALLLRVVALVATLPVLETIDGFLDRPFLQIFEDELRDNIHLKERWVKIIRLRAGMDDGKVASYSTIGKQLDLSGDRISQMERQAWIRIKAKEPWKSLTVGLINGLLKNLWAWPTLEILEDEEPWFRGAVASPEVFRYIIQWIGKGEITVIKINSVYVCRRRPTAAQEPTLG
jgi:hypothetical protein